PLDGAHGGEAGGAQKVEDHEGGGGDSGEVRGDQAPDLGAVLTELPDGGVEYAEGCHHARLSDGAGDHGHSGLPGAEAQGHEDEGDGGADGGQHGVVHVLHHAEGAVLPAEALEEAQDDGGGQDHCAGPLDEGPAPLPGGPQHVAGGGDVVGGQLHDEGGRVAGESLGLLEHHAGDDDGGHADEVGGHGHKAAAAEQGAGDQADDGQLGAAGDEAGGHDGHAAVPLALNGAGGHDAGHDAAGAHQHGDKALAGQAEL